MSVTLVCMDEFLYPEANLILDEARTRHQNVWPFAMEAIALAHRAFDRQRELAAPLVPGVPKLSRTRHDINDDAWRFFRSIAEPLVGEGHIADFTTVDGGDVAVMSDGLHIRLKKGNSNGETSNYPTPKISRMARDADRYTLYPDATELDVYIQDGLGIDVVFVVGASMAEYTQIGLRFMNARVSPFVVLDPPTSDQLAAISPAAYELVTDARARLTA